jgi:phosphoserine phosphatase
LRLILVRHGETHWNEEKRVQGGDADIELNDTGLEQARRVAAFLAREPVTAVLSSPLQRARITAEIIAGRHSLPVEVDERLRELRVGELDGMSIAALNTTFSQFLLQRWQAGEASRLPNDETFVQLQDRTWTVVQDLLQRANSVCTNPGPSTEQTMVVVSHFFVTLAIILKALDLPPDCFTRFRVGLASVSILEFGDSITRLVTFNDTSY